MTDATNHDNRDITEMTGYQEDRINALKQRVKDLEEEVQDLRKQLDAAEYEIDTTKEQSHDVE